MKQKHLLGSLTLGATLLLASVMTSSCTLNPSDIAKISRDDRPAYLRDSEEWGKVVKQTISTTPFTRIDATGNVDIIFTQASNISVVAEGNEKVLERYDIGTHDGTLYMKYKEQRRGNNNVPTIRLHVSAAALSSINLLGAGDFKAKKPVILPNDFSVNVTGAGDIELQRLSCRNFTLEVTGAGDLSADHISCDNLAIGVSGAGDIECDTILCTSDATMQVGGAGDITAAVKARNLTVVEGGAGDIEINSLQCDVVTATASGAGDIEIEGEARKLIKNVNGLASIRSKNLRVKDIDY